ncbi:MAG: SOUL family heme-binding protein [Fidelibacterota bacterium]
MAIEKPEYRVIQEFEDFEIREYAPYLVAEVEIENDFENAGSDAFSILFDYISGNNTKQQKISMTAPVNQTRAEKKGEKIAMTAPVAQQKSNDESGKYRVSFVVPAKYTLNTVPEPSNSRVKIRQVPGQIIAAIKYRGNWSRNRYQKYEQLLMEKLEEKNIEMTGKPIFARYNPPFWPAFMRRNEILIPVGFAE